jgi:hypothetical protein
MPVLQCAISQKADAWLRKKKNGRGLGVVVSELVIEAAVREEFQQALRANKEALQDSWAVEANLDAVE